jgi:hypothetical protein
MILETAVDLPAGRQAASSEKAVGQEFTGSTG